MFVCRLGLKSLVLESSESSRTTGFALNLWTNAWRALDAVGVAPSLRQRSLHIRGWVLDHSFKFIISFQFVCFYVCIENY